MVALCSLREGPKKKLYQPHQPSNQQPGIQAASFLLSPGGAAPPRTPPLFQRNESEVRAVISDWTWSYRRSCHIGLKSIISTYDGLAFPSARAEKKKKNYTNPTSQATNSRAYKLQASCFLPVGLRPLGPFRFSSETSRKRELSYRTGLGHIDEAVISD